MARAGRRIASVGLALVVLAGCTTPARQGAVVGAGTGTSSFRADSFPPAMKGEAPAEAAGPAISSGSAPAAASRPSEPAGSPATPAAGGPSSVTLYQDTPPAPPLAATASTEGARIEVVLEESTLHRDAMTRAAPVGRVVRGERVMYLDSIDRRLRIFNAVVFDGGHWIKIRAADGTEGWLPASKLCEAP